MSQKQEAVVQLTDERVALNTIELKIKALLDDGVSGRPETSLALRANQLASMWLGKALGALKVPHPYPQSYDSKSKVIEKRVDMPEKWNRKAFLKEQEDEISHIKALRADLKAMEKKIQNDMLILTNLPEYQLAVANAYTNCCNATMWLGMVLNAIKNEGEKPARKPKEEKKAEKSDDTKEKPTGVMSKVAKAVGEFLNQGKEQENGEGAKGN